MHVSMQPALPPAATPGHAPAHAPGHGRELLSVLGSGPLMIEDGFLAQVLARLESGQASSDPTRSGAVAGQEEMSWFTGRWDPQNRLNVTDDGIAIIRVHGLLLARGPWLGSIWGATTYEGLAEQFKRLGADASIRTVILDIDSGGGMAAGIWDLMPALDALKDKKPVHAIANPFCASAAYAIGCAATTFHVNRGAATGSIGVVRPHVDMSAALEKWGMRYTMFKAGAFKTAGSATEPLTPEVRAYIQADVDVKYAEFTAHVAKYRGLPDSAVRATEARVYNAADAVSLGLADGVMSFEELLDHVRNVPASRARSRANSTGGNSMTTAPGAALSQGDLANLAASIAAAMPQPERSAPARLSSTQSDATITRAEAERMSAEAADKAVKADRERTAAVLALPEAKGHEAHALKLAHQTSLSVDDIKGMLADLPKADAKGAGGYPHALAAAMSQPGTSAGIKPEAGKPADGSTVSATAHLKPLGDFVASRFATSSKKRS